MSRPPRLENVTVFVLQGPFVLGTMFSLQAALREPSVKGAIVDLSNIPDLDSAALGVLPEQWAHAQRTRQKFALAGVSERAMTFLKITRTDIVVPI